MTVTLRDKIGNGTSTINSAFDLVDSDGPSAATSGQPASSRSGDAAGDKDSDASK